MSTTASAANPTMNASGVATAASSANPPNVTVGKLSIPMDHCSPFVLRLAQELTQCREENSRLHSEYIRLLGREGFLEKEVADLKRKVAELSPSKPVDDDLFKLDKFVSDCLVREDGAEISLRDVLSAYSSWTEEQHIYQPSNKKRMLADIMTKHFGDPIRGILPTGAVTINLIWAGVRRVEEE